MGEGKSIRRKNSVGGVTGLLTDLQRKEEKG